MATAEDATLLRCPDGLEENVSVRGSSSEEQERKEKKTAGGDERAVQVTHLWLRPAKSEWRLMASCDDLLTQKKSPASAISIRVQHLSAFNPVKARPPPLIDPPTGRSTPGSSPNLLPVEPLKQ